jgi:hypothetical protein
VLIGVRSAITGVEEVGGGIWPPAENVIGRAVRLCRARADRDFTGSVSLGPRELDLTSIPGRYRSEVFKMSVRPVYPSYFPDIRSVGTSFNVGVPENHGS